MERSSYTEQSINCACTLCMYMYTYMYIHTLPPANEACIAKLMHWYMYSALLFDVHIHVMCFPFQTGGDTCCSSFTTIPHDKKAFCVPVSSGKHIQRRLKSRKRISFPFLINKPLTHSIPQQPINHLESNQVTTDHESSINKADLKKEANTADLFGETVKSSGFSTLTKKSQRFSHLQSSTTRRQSLDNEAIVQGGTQVGSNTRWCQSSKMTKFTAEAANHLKQGKCTWQYMHVCTLTSNTYMNKEVFMRLL